MADQPADAAATAQAQNQQNQRAQAGHPAQPQAPEQAHEHQGNEHEVLLDLARQLRQHDRTDDQTNRTVVFTEEEVNAMADMLEQMAPRLHQQAVEHRGSRREAAKPEDKK